MDNFSNLRGTVPVPPVSSGVLKIEKKRKIHDEKGRKGRKRKNSKDGETEERGFIITITEEAEEKHVEMEDENHELQVDADETENSKPHIIDIKI